MTNINFPDSPSDEQVFGERKYNSSKGVWEDYVLPGDTTPEDLLLPGQIYGYPIEYLVIAGGGAGRLPGGGAGGYRCSVTGESSGGGFSAEKSLILGSGAYTVTVGAGGAPSNVDANGSDSVLESITSIGGGGATSNVGNSGGSGSGSALASNAGGAGEEGQGFAGGRGNGDGISTLAGGGGGGAGQPGPQSPSPTSPVSGGDGLSSEITGTAVTRGGGGAAINLYGTTGAPGGSGGGGASGVNGTDGDANTGGGGGARNGSSGTTPGAGGSGVVIFKISPFANVSFSVGLTEANGGSGQTVGDYKVYTVTAGTGTVTIS